MKKFLNTVPIFIYKRNKKELKDIITFMIPITEEDERNIKIGLAVDTLIYIESGLTIIPKEVQVFGNTDDIPDHVIKDFIIDSMWFNSISDLKTRECILTDNGLPSIHEMTDKKYLIKLGIAMLGTPEKVMIANMGFNRYIESEFYNKYVKHAKN